jgi:hypothetical protein
MHTAAAGPRAAAGSVGDAPEAEHVGAAAHTLDDIHFARVCASLSHDILILSQRSRSLVIPAKARLQRAKRKSKNWTPAFAGVTEDPTDTRSPFRDAFQRPEFGKVTPRSFETGLRPSSPMRGWRAERRKPMVPRSSRITAGAYRRAMSGDLTTPDRAFAVSVPLARLFFLFLLLSPC